MAERMYVCSIAGHDPSAGAGVTADLKTFEMHKVYGFGVLTATTWQNDERVERVQWLSTSDILSQLALLVPRFTVDYYKIGIIENTQRLLQVSGYIRQVNPLATIIWDPVLRASADYPFFQGPADWKKLMGRIDWLTPNQPEFERLIGSDEQALELSQHFTILKKGGHAQEQRGRDLLFYKGNCHILDPETTKEVPSPKHGSGCVLAAAICANLARGASPIEACQLAKRYIEKFLSSNSSLLGWHNV
ncbi:phosphomethylpyrimidine kinase [Flammeovirgaceae bacterium 311]|nr:phosphomethylpyrimidine kinase [Flammeovirgaceae bacterium 311]